MDEQLGRAYRLAYFLHGDRETALRIVVSAASKLEVAAVTQHKRLYYRPAGRPSADHGRSAGFRNRVSFNEQHLLQRLIYIESEPFERLRETGGEQARDCEDALVYYIKHLVRISLKRNSFYITLGISRLLYGYTTSETMEVYNAVLQDPDRSKDDYYYRSRKAVLMQELKRRFGDLLRVSRGTRGEEGFEPDRCQERFTGLVRKCLSFLTPWNTPCLVPANWNLLAEALPSFNSADSGEDQAEVNRIHAVLHPDCFDRLASAKGFDPPDLKLRVPHFFMSGSDAGGNSQRRDPPALCEEDLQSIKGHLVEQATRRRRAQVELLKIFVDGDERARLDRGRSRRARFRVGPDAEMIEVRASDPQGEVLLATYLLASMSEASQPRRVQAAVTLVDGRAITFAFRSSLNASGEIEGWRVEVRQMTGSLGSRLRLLARGLVADPVESLFAGRRRAPRLWTALTASVIVLSLLGLALWVRTKNSESVQHAATGAVKAGAENGVGPAARRDESVAPAVARSPAVTPSPPGNETPVQASETAKRRAPERSGGMRRSGPAPPSRESAARDRRKLPGGVSPAEGAAGGETLRSPRATTGIDSLSAARKLCVLIEGGGPEATELSQVLAARLGASGRLTLVQDLEEADVCLKLLVTREGSGGDTGGRRLTVTARLVNAVGTLLRLSPRHPGAVEYSGTPEQIAGLIVADADEEIRHPTRPR